MTSPDVLKELGIIGHQPRGRYMVPDNEESWAPSGDWVKKSDVIQAIERGDLIPRSRIEEILLSLKKGQEHHFYYFGYYEKSAVKAIEELGRLLKETKP